MLYTQRFFILIQETEFPIIFCKTKASNVLPTYNVDQQEPTKFDRSISGIDWKSSTVIDVKQKSKMVSNSVSKKHTKDRILAHQHSVMLTVDLG